MSQLEPVTFKRAYRASEEEGLQLFASAQAMHVCAVGEDGWPLVRTLHGVVSDGRIAFHAGDRGGKLAFLEQRVVVSVEEILAEIPSTFTDPVRACPATTYFLSATAHGTLTRVQSIQRKAEVLTALMRRFQPEGGYAPITPDDPQYHSALESILVAELVPERITTKYKLGQNRDGEAMSRVLDQLFARGRPGDLRTIRLVHEHHPEHPLPHVLRGPEGFALCAAPDRQDAEQVARLLEGLYWTQPFSQEELVRAQLGSPAWVVARDTASGEVVASARALSDGARLAYVMDVIVHPSLRGRGLGKVIMQLLMRHPAVRNAYGLRLRTRDAQAFYRGLGFFIRTEANDEMVRVGVA